MKNCKSAINFLPLSNCQIIEMNSKNPDNIRM